jgi:hypothetical protein
VSAPQRDRQQFHDPADRAEAYSVSLVAAQVTVADRAKARLKAASMATGPDDLAHLLDVLGLNDRGEIAAQLGQP